VGEGQPLDQQESGLAADCARLLADENFYFFRAPLKDSPQAFNRRLGQFRVSE
jgi:hypothetical protein